MADDSLREAIAANLDWLKGIRLADRSEWAWLGVPAALSLIVLAACLAFTATPPAYSLTGAAAHLSFVICLYFAAPRTWLPPLSLLIFLSEMNLLIYIWTGAPKLGAVQLTYGILALIAASATVVASFAAQRKLGRLDSASGKDDFHWLVTAAPLSLRRRSRSIVCELSSRS